MRIEKLKLKKKFQIFLKNQVRDCCNNQVVHNVSGGRYYISTPAGDMTIIFYDPRPRNINAFRDKFINRVAMAKEDSDFFKVYRDIIKSKKAMRYRVRLSRNLHTTMKGKVYEILKH